MKMKKFWARGGRASLTTPLDPPLHYVNNFDFLDQGAPPLAQIEIEIADQDSGMVLVSSKFELNFFFF